MGEWGLYSWLKLNSVRMNLALQLSLAIIILWWKISSDRTYLSSYILHNRSGHFLIKSTVPVWSWSWSLENINNFRGNLLSFYRSGGGVRNTFFRQITPHNRCYILPKLLHYKKVAGFVQNTTKNCARRYYLGYDLIVISLVCYMNGWGWVVRNVRNNMSLSTLK